MLDCGDEVAGSCSGGYPAGVWQWARHRGGAPELSCMQYEADDTRKCSEVTTCRQCNRKTTSDKSSTCWGVSETGGYGPTDAGAGPGTIYSNGVPRASVASYGFVAGEASMKAEILTRGPIVCLVDGAELKAYSGGVLSKTKASDYTHALVVLGWGYDDVAGKSYWQCRNSWGEAWGEAGFVRVERSATLLDGGDDGWKGEGALGIEGECTYAVPDEWGYLLKHSSSFATEAFDQDTVQTFWRRLRAKERAEEEDEDEEEEEDETDDGDASASAARAAARVELAAAAPARDAAAAAVSPSGGWTASVATAGAALALAVVGAGFRRRRRASGYAAL